MESGAGTDVAIFDFLANKNLGGVTNLSGFQLPKKPRAEPSGGMFSRAVESTSEEGGEAVETDVQSTDDDEPAAQPSLFSQQVSMQQERAPSRARSRASSSHRRRAAPEPARAYVPPQPASEASESDEPTRGGMPDEHDEDDDFESSYPSRDLPESERNKDRDYFREKQELLMELQKMKKTIVLTREYTMHDTLSDIKYEHDKHRDNTVMVDNLNMARKGLCMLFLGIEKGNTHFGPYLGLDGWAKHMLSDMDSFERCMERLYKRYWRHGQVHPILEFFGLIVGSMVLFHFEGQFFGSHGTVKKMMNTAGAFMGAAAPKLTAQAAPSPFSFLFNGGGGSGGSGGASGAVAAQPFARQSHNFAPNNQIPQASQFPPQPRPSAFAASNDVIIPETYIEPSAPSAREPDGRRLMPDRQMKPPQALDDLLADPISNVTISDGSDSN
jgi:hypothetical protein